MDSTCDRNRHTADAAAGSTQYAMVARLIPAVSVGAADREVKAIARRLEEEYPQFRRGWTYRLIPLRQNCSRISPDATALRW